MFTILCWVVGLALVPLAIQVFISLVVLASMIVAAPFVLLFNLFGGEK